jgi:hypothetical protein
MYDSCFNNESCFRCEVGDTRQLETSLGQLWRSRTWFLEVVRIGLAMAKHRELNGLQCIWPVRGAAEI